MVAPSGRWSICSTRPDLLDGLAGFGATLAGGAEAGTLTASADFASRAIRRGRFEAGLFSTGSIIGWYSLAERHFAAATTQGPAGRAGQGSGLTPGPRFTDDTNACAAGEVQWNVAL